MEGKKGRRWYVDGRKKGKEMVRRWKEEREVKAIERNGDGKEKVERGRNGKILEGGKVLHWKG